MRCQECRQQIFGILDCEKENRYLKDEDEEICPICQDILGTEIELGKMIEKYVTCNGIATGIERITRNRH
jgi:hypothetical protein